MPKWGLTIMMMFFLIAALVGCTDNPKGPLIDTALST